jgi:hypothetical protein
MSDFETVRDALSYSASTWEIASAKREEGKIALDRIEAECDRLREDRDEQHRIYVEAAMEVSRLTKRLEAVYKRDQR